jgi:hypothetical protein
MTKIRNTDPRILDDINSASNEAKQFHDAKAAQEASQIAAKYKGTPTFAKLVSMHLASQTDAAYSKHMAALAASDPKKQAYDKLKAEVTAEVRRDLGLDD